MGLVRPRCKERDGEAPEDERSRVLTEIESDTREERNDAGSRGEGGERPPRGPLRTTGEELGQRRETVPCETGPLSKESEEGCGLKERNGGRPRGKNCAGSDRVWVMEKSGKNPRGTRGEWSFHPRGENEKDGSRSIKEGQTTRDRDWREENHRGSRGSAGRWRDRTRAPRGPLLDPLRCVARRGGRETRVWRARRAERSSPATPEIRREGLESRDREKLGPSLWARLGWSSRCSRTIRERNN